MLVYLLAAIVGFAEPVTAVNQPPVTIENWNGEDLTYTTEPLPPRPIDPAGTQLFWIPTAKTLAPRAVRLANNMFIFSQAGVGVTENLQASLSNTLLVAFTGDVKYRFWQKENFNAAVQAGAMMVAFNRTAVGYGRAIVTYGDDTFSLTANAGYGAGEMYGAVDSHYVGTGHVVAGSLGGASRLTHYAVMIAEGSVGQGIRAPFQGTLATGLAGVRLHGKQVAFDAGVVGVYINDGYVKGGIPLPWVGLSWLDP